MSANTPESYKCKVCGTTFNSQSEMESHNRDAHIETVGKKH